MFFAQADLKAADEARAIAIDNSKATDVFISGATGPSAALINGHYVPTQETGLDATHGLPLYMKSDCLHVCIEHRRKVNCSGIRSFAQGDSVWQVKHVWSKGTDQCFAGVEGGCALEACVSRVWRVGISNEFREQPNVKMVTGVAARRAVTDPFVTILHSTFTHSSLVAPILKKRFSLLIHMILTAFLAVGRAQHCQSARNQR